MMQTANRSSIMIRMDHLDKRGMVDVFSEQIVNGG